MFDAIPMYVRERCSACRSEERHTDGSTRNFSVREKEETGKC